MMKGIMKIIGKKYIGFIGSFLILYMWNLVWNNQNMIVFILAAIVMYFYTENDKNKNLMFLFFFVSYITLIYAGFGILLELFKGVDHDFRLHHVADSTKKIINISYISAIILWLSNTKIANIIYKAVSKK